MHAGETSDPDEAKKEERLIKNSQRLLLNMVNKRKLQTESETSPIKFCINGGEARSGKGSSADEGKVLVAKYVAAQEEMEGKVSSIKYRVPEVIKMRMEESSSSEKFKSKDGTGSKGGAKRTLSGDSTVGGEVEGGSANKKRRVSKSVEGDADRAVPGVRVARKTSPSEEDGEMRIRTRKQSLSSARVGSAKKQPKVNMNLSPKGGKEIKVKRVEADVKARKEGRRFPPTKQILGETPLGDQTW